MAISGSFNTALNESIQSVETVLSDMNHNSSEYQYSDEEGIYAFQDVPAHGDYMVKGIKNDDYLNGVSTIDLLKIQRHILRSEVIDSPYKMIAADINKDRRIDGLDLLELRKLILGLYDELPQNDSWIFVDKSQVLTLDNVWEYRDSLFVRNLSQSMLDESFVGVKVGDLNDDVVSNVIDQSTQLGISSPVNLSYEDRWIATNELVEIQLNTTEKDLFGYQFTLDFEGLELTNVSGRDIAEVNYHDFGEVLTLSHHSDYPLDETSSILTLTFRASQEGRLSEILDLNSSLTKAEGYLGVDYESRDLNLVSDYEEVFSLKQNKPNPFSNDTQIEFVLPKSGNYALTFYDINGKTIQTIEGPGVAGTNSVYFEKSSVNTSGVIYYKLDFEELTAMKRMMLIE